MSSVLKKADKLNLSLSLLPVRVFFYVLCEFKIWSGGGGGGGGRDGVWI